MRRVAAATLAVPVLALLYVPVLLRRSIAARIVLALGVGTIAGLGVIGLVGPGETTATPASRPVPLPQAAFTTDLRAGIAPDAPLTIRFSTPMVAASVKAHLDISPPTPVALAWNEAGTALTIRPTTTWDTGRFHTVTIAPGALADSGRPTSGQIRSVFLTRPPTTASIAPSRPLGDRAAIDTAFDVSFSGSVDPATLDEAVRITPVVNGRFERLGRRTGNLWRFVPDEPLAPGTEYRVWLAPTVRDGDGAALGGEAVATVVTVPRPQVVRFRPADKSSRVGWDQTVSVRFTEPMDRGSTTAALSVTAGGAAVAGAIDFAENDTVLVFDPKANFGYAQTISVTIGADARSALGVPLGAPVAASFGTAPKPQPVVRAAPPRTGGTGGSGGGSAGSGSWAAVESYYLGLMNCTRTGGTVNSSGGCSGAGTRSVAPLVLDANITAKVARPYAKMLATTNQCSHFIGGNPGDRLRAAGYTGYTWAENLGCRSGDPYAAVLGSHLYFQGERSWSPPGGHYVNLMNAAYKRVGIGVWVSGGRVRLVVDFIG